MIINPACFRLLLAARLTVEGAPELPAGCGASFAEEHESVSLLQLGARTVRSAAGPELLLDSIAVNAARAEIEKIGDLRRSWGQGQALDHQHRDIAFFSGGARYMELHKEDYPSLSDGHLEPKDANAHGHPNPNHKAIFFQESISSEEEQSFERPISNHMEILVQESTVVDTSDSKALSDIATDTIAVSPSKASLESSESSSTAESAAGSRKHRRTKPQEAAENANFSMYSVSLLSPLFEFLSGSANNDSGAANDTTVLVTKNATVSAPPKEENPEEEGVAGVQNGEQEFATEKQEGSYCQAMDDPDEGFDREGGDLLARPVNGSVASCVEKCCNTAGCLAYVYAKAPSNYGLCEEGKLCCYLKSEVTEKKQSEYESVATGLVRRQGTHATLSQAWKNASSHSLTDVVGKGGVLQIALETRPEWENREDGHITTEGEEDEYQKRSLTLAGIAPTIFNATNAETSSEEELRQGCRLEADPDTEGFCKDNKKDGSGCKSRVESAIADSHRRALLAALARNESDWTLIMEDDVVPVNPAEWNRAFQEAWPKLPSQYKLIRLGWCTFEEDLGLLRKTSDVNGTGPFQLNNWMSWRDAEGGDHYYSGGCTTAYMVHKEIIPELLNIFPCCCPLDCCLEGGLYYQPTNEPDLFRGQQVMTNMDTNNTEEYSHLFTFFNQSGVLVQDNRQMRSTRPEYNQTAFLEVRNHSFRHSVHGETRPSPKQ